MSTCPPDPLYPSLHCSVPGEAVPWDEVSGLPWALASSWIPPMEGERSEGRE